MNLTILLATSGLSFAIGYIYAKIKKPNGYTEIMEPELQKQSSAEEKPSEYPIIQEYIPIRDTEPNELTISTAEQSIVDTILPKIEPHKSPYAGKPGYTS